jgi:hypothetical protein
MKMTELHNRLQELGISETQYYLHGLHGSTNDDEKLSLTIRKNGDVIEYLTYFKERGARNSERIFLKEEEACQFLYEKLILEWLFWKMKKVDGLSGMTVNERLYTTGLLDYFDKYRRKDKTIARQILNLIQVDKPSIDKILD